MNTDKDQQILATRAPKALRRQLDRAARKSDRTLSAEIRIRLEASLRLWPVLGAASDAPAAPAKPVKA